MRIQARFCLSKGRKRPEDEAESDAEVVWEKRINLLHVEILLGELGLA